MSPVAKDAASKNAVRSLPLLVIEDEPSVMILLRSALERSGYAIVQAPSGVEGLHLLGTELELGRDAGKMVVVVFCNKERHIDKPHRLFESRVLCNESNLMFV